MSHERLVLRRGCPCRSGAFHQYLAVALAGLVLCLAGAAVSADAVLQRLKSFGFPDQLGLYPQAPVLLGSDGALYGTTSGGGRNQTGTVFRMNRDGSGLRILYDLGPGGENLQPQAALIEGSDGVLYGTTWADGTDQAGTVFKLNKDGSGYHFLHSFSTGGDDGKMSAGELVEGDDGTLYGTTFGGGTGRVGTVFKLNKDGSSYSILHHFTFNSAGADGAAPKSGLIKSSDGQLYGTTSQGGSAGVGTVYRLHQDGSGYAVLYSFGQTANDGYEPRAPLVEGTDGALYGTSASGGQGATGALQTGNGTVFKMARDGGTYSILHRFSNAEGDGSQPLGRLARGADGALYGTTSAGGTNDLSNSSGIVFKINQDGTGYALLHEFSFREGDGSRPAAGLVQASDGTLYGTTEGPGLTFGTVFKLNPDGSGYETLASAGGDGILPQAALLEASDGALYSVTAYGGRNGAGTVFRLNKDASGYGFLHHFPAFPGDGYRPEDRLLEANDGTLYGTTPCGGADNLGTVFRLKKDGSGYALLHHFTTTPGAGGGYGMPVCLGWMSGDALYGTTMGLGRNDLGTVFRMNLDGSGYQTLHEFGNLADGDGAMPRGELCHGSDGALYGTTYAGGSQLVGTIFKINPDGSGYSILRQFQFGTEGCSPTAGLTEGSDGVLYGTTSPGCQNGAGTVFRLSKDGSNFATLHSFSLAESAWSVARVIESTDGALYGTIRNAANSGGSVFRLNKDGTGYMVLYRFSVGLPGALATQGSQPAAALTQGSDGAFYGTTRQGGDMAFPGFGSVFRLLPPEAPRLISVALAGGVMEVGLSGVAGRQYEVLRSVDLKQWTVLTNVTMPAVGWTTSPDPHPIAPNACYRARWRP